MEPIIHVQELRKEFRTAVRHKNLIHNLFEHKYTVKKAVDSISFDIQPGELVGFIGPNGAGKSTTIKMMTGILLPTGGTVQVLGNDPYRKRKQNAANIGVVFGQRSQLWWDLPVGDSFELLRKIYDVDEPTYRENVDTFGTILNLKEYWDKPVRQLSLGQRMRADIAAALLHSPQVIFLDEPTIGLDVVVKKEIREFIKEIRRQRGVTVVLTTHDMKDIDEICERVIMIDSGKLVLDLSVAEIKKKLGNRQSMELRFEKEPEVLTLSGVEIEEKEPLLWSVRFDHNRITASEIISRLSQQARISDVAIREPDIEDIIRNIYTGEISL